MRYWLRGKGGGLLAFLLITGLVAGGLGWVTAAALRLEREQREVRAETELRDKLRLALWRLDGLVTPTLAKENSRPYNHFSAVYAPALALSPAAFTCAPGSVLQVSPLLDAELPAWMLLHFQADAEQGWSSPQVLSPSLLQKLAGNRPPESLTNVTKERAGLLARLRTEAPPGEMLAQVQQLGAQLTLTTDTTLEPSNFLQLEANPPGVGQNPGLNFNNRGQAGNRLGNNDLAPQQAQAPFPPQQTMIDPEYRSRAGQKDRQMRNSTKADDNQDSALILGNLTDNGERWFAGPGRRQPKSGPVSVSLGPLVPLWMTTADNQELLSAVRLVQVGEKQVCQGLVLDAGRLQELLAEEVRDLFPDARIVPVRGDDLPPSERTMTALPFQLDPGPPPPGKVESAWRPLRIGLALAWLAALVALAAVGLGGWSLLDLSERRIRFVSAVTHELRTPLTTLRLYLDMLTGGMVREERQKEEYLHTLHAETERLNRLVANVLDFSRLENQRPRLAKAEVLPAELLGQVLLTWQGRCQDAGKELLLEDRLPGDLALFTDGQLVQQVLGNLIDNACKYTRGAEDNRIWLRADRAGRGVISFEVEDRGPGVPPRERRTIFRPFRRGGGADVTAGGVGLGLALAQRWAGLLGGHLRLCGRGEQGACFRLELPLT